MDDLVSRIHGAFSFERPPCVVIHSGDECFDCPDVADTLDGTDCDSMLQSSDRLFGVIPMDCMSADAFLHYLPAIVRESFTADGLTVAETVAWILGADEWETDSTISEQIKPMLNREQTQLLRDLLAAYSQLPFSAHASGQLSAAIKCWAE